MWIRHWYVGTWYSSWNSMAMSPGISCWRSLSLWVSSIDSKPLSCMLMCGRMPTGFVSSDSLAPCCRGRESHDFVIVDLCDVPALILLPSCLPRDTSTKSSQSNIIIVVILPVFCFLWLFSLVDVPWPEPSAQDSGKQINYLLTSIAVVLIEYVCQVAFSNRHNCSRTSSKNMIDI